ncbi:carbon-monoxide dehydrogenase small subunit [Natranaerovirga pectinivora]|uniref:Carbon-monoxide dehydrogenase small subunit n=1 Tax=Natranaerovirga pectinivora TaxID=682400 RepID=A0A4V2V0L1_9FIRM|nr:(2Fe-2S)-binding protein [Natranaerovirga pectinivora]TCT16739.1 carbon-monoxide dehydrogenase small subunit [Natranaerovirga pectinivora]
MYDLFKLRLNDDVIDVKAHPSKRLLDVLRDDLGITSCKEGCGEGECGACAVLIDGNLINSCLVPIGSIKDTQIYTVEGYKKTKRFEMLNECFAEAGAVQCGFCIPGMIMAAEGLLSKKPNPSEEEVREAISGNLCRCTGYNMIVDAILLAAEKGGYLW